MLEPSKCLRRWCLICGKEMGLEYDSHSEDRVYKFSCTTCGTIIPIFEEINQNMRQILQREGHLLEPMTREEEEEQAVETKSTEVFFRDHPELVERLKREENRLFDLLYIQKLVLKNVLLSYKIRYRAVIDRESSGIHRNQADSSSSAVEPRLGPEKCLERRCRICNDLMRLEYEWNSKLRQYCFHCIKCGTVVRLVEDIIKEMRKDYKNDGYTLEPLTRKEKMRQTVVSLAGEWIFEKLSQQYKKSIGVKSVRIKQKINRLSYDEAERMK